MNLFPQLDSLSAIAILFRLCAYFAIFYAIDAWQSGDERGAPPTRAAACAIARLVIGPLLGAFIVTQFTDTGEQLNELKAIMLVVSRVFVWTLLFGLMGVRSARIVFGVAGGMLVNLAADALFGRPSLFGFPLYC